MEVNKIKSEVKRLAKEFDLKYNSKWFDYMWITKRDEIILQYIGNCLDKVYDRYENYPEGRIKNISQFFNSDLKNLSKRYGGEVYSKESLLYQKRLLDKIKDSKIKKEISKLLNKIDKKLRNNKIILITKTNIKKENQGIIRILRHEFIHLLLFNNNIEFGKISNKLWMYDEGLCTYLEAFLDNTINILEARYSRINYPYEKQYYELSLTFKKRLDKIITPEQRRKVILNIIKEQK